MTKLGRPLNQQTATAFDYRRYLTLVQILALDESEASKLNNLKYLCEAWGLPVYGPFDVLTVRLAKAAVAWKLEAE